MAVTDVDVIIDSITSGNTLYLLAIFPAFLPFSSLSTAPLVTFEKQARIALPTVTLIDQKTPYANQAQGCPQSNVEFFKLKLLQKMNHLMTKPRTSPPPRIGWHYDTYFLEQLVKLKKKNTAH